MKLLPAGSIVTVEDGTFMVAGFGMISDEKCYRYALIPYPAGMTFDSAMIITDEIGDVQFEGFADEEHQTLELLTEAAIVNYNSIKITDET